MSSTIFLFASLAMYRNEGSKWPLNQPCRHRIFVLSGMATVYPTDLFFSQWPLCTLLAGSNLSLQKIVLDIEIVTTKGSKLVFLIKNCYCWGKNFVPDTSLLGKKLYTAPICRGKKLYRAVTPIVPSGALFLLHIQDAGYNFTTKPFSSRPGGYKGAIDRKRILTMIITEISVVFSLFLIRWTPTSKILIIKHQRLSKAVKALIQRDDEEEACWLSSFFFKLGLQKHNFE